jgi:hypothetical protein
MSNIYVDRLVRFWYIQRTSKLHLRFCIDFCQYSRFYVWLSSMYRLPPYVILIRARTSWSVPPIQRYLHPQLPLAYAPNMRFVTSRSNNRKVPKKTTILNPSNPQRVHALSAGPKERIAWRMIGQKGSWKLPRGCRSWEPRHRNRLQTSRAHGWGVAGAWSRHQRRR